MMAGRHIRFTAVLAVVVFSLTGFSSGHGKHSSGGGGCSSSKHHGSSSNNSTTSSSNGKSNSSAPAHAQVVSCAGPGSPTAVLQVTSDVDTQRTVDVPLVFEGNAGTVDRTSVRVSLKPRETQKVTVPMTAAGKAADVQRCQVGRIS